MLHKRRKSGNSFGPDGKLIRGCAVARPSSNNLFRPGQKIVVARAPIMPGLSLITKPFQRPMLSRRAYKGDADAALKIGSLGQKRRMDGMARLMARSGKGLNFLPQKRRTEKDEMETESEDEEEEEDRPFEPLMVWNSPHQGGFAKGLPSSM